MNKTYTKLQEFYEYHMSVPIEQILEECIGLLGGDILIAIVVRGRKWENEFTWYMEKDIPVVVKKITGDWDDCYLAMINDDQSITIGLRSNGFYNVCHTWISEYGWDPRISKIGSCNEDTPPENH